MNKNDHKNDLFFQGFEPVTDMMPDEHIDPDDERFERCRRGEEAEKRLDFELTKRKCVVFCPRGHGTAVDLFVVGPDKRVRSVQVKTAIRTQVGATTIGVVLKKNQYRVDDFQVLAVYNRTEQLFHFFDWQKLENKRWIHIPRGDWKPQLTRWDFFGCPWQGISLG